MAFVVMAAIVLLTYRRMLAIEIWTIVSIVLSELREKILCMLFFYLIAMSKAEHW